MDKYVVLPCADGKFKISKEAFNCLKTVAVLGAFLAVTVTFYVWYEGWTIGSSITFIIVTMSTVGYGYTYPSDDNSRLFTIFVMIFGVFGVYSAINQVVETRLRTLNAAARKKEHDLSSAEIYRRQHRRVLLNIFLILASLFAAAGAFSLIEDMTFAQGLYFATQTACTVGFGDVPLKKKQSQQLIGFYILFSTILMTFAFNNFKNLHEDFQRVKEAAEFAKRKKTLAKIKELDTGNGVPMDTFLLAVLEQLGVLDRERDLEPWIKKFKEIDADNSGYIDAEEIEAFSAQEKTLAAQQLAQMKRTTYRDGHIPGFHSKFSNSFTKTFGLGFGDPLADEDDEVEGEVDDLEDADRHSESSYSTVDSAARRGETLRVGKWQFLLFGSNTTQRPGLGRHGSHNHSGRRDLVPPDMHRELLSLSVDQEDHVQMEPLQDSAPEERFLAKSTSTATASEDLV